MTPHPSSLTARTCLERVHTLRDDETICVKHVNFYFWLVAMTYDIELGVISREWIPGGGLPERMTLNHVMQPGQIAIYREQPGATSTLDPSFSPYQATYHPPKMQALANAAQSYMGPAPGSVVENEYKPDPSGKKMKALTWQGADNVKLMECDVPAITQDKDVILKVSCA